MAGDANNSANGAGANGAGDEKSAGELQKMQTELESTKNELSSLKAAKDELQRKIEDADRELLGEDYLTFLEAKRGKTDNAKGAKTDVNFDEMSAKQIAEYFEAKYKGDLEKAAKDISDKMNAVGDSVANLAARTDLSISCIKHPDLGDALDTPIKSRTPEQTTLVDGMLKIANENPTWNTEKCYRQAKLEIKTSEEEKLAKDSAKAEKERKALTEKGGANPAGFEGKPISKDAAADAAWHATFGNKASID